jgi:hypothetical protein
MTNFFEYNDDYPIFLDLVKTSSQMKIFIDNNNKHHSYKKFNHSPTRNIRFNIFESVSGNNIGSIGLSSATIAIKCRDDYIGWNKALRIKNLGMLAANSRFVLIRERITIKNAGSMTLKRLEIDGSRFWIEKYNQPLILIETFIEPSENRVGCVYKSANWIEIGKTSGTSIKKAPLLLWQKESGLRGELSRKDPKAAMEKYGYGGKEYIVSKSPAKIMFVKPLVWNWKKILNI